MWPVIGLTALAIAIAVIELPALVKEKFKKEIAVFTVLLLVGYSLSILIALQVDIPPILKGIEYIYAPISKVIFSLLK